MNRLLKSVIGLMLTLTLSACTMTLDTSHTATTDEAEPSAPGADFGEAWESVSCETFGLPDVIAEISDCGYVTAPERHSEPNGPTVELAVVRVRSTGDDPTPDPLFMEQGGPGGSTIAIFPTAALPALADQQAILDTRDMVYVEQRGTLFSKPYLYCPEEVDHDIQVLKGQADEDDLSWVEACRDRLEEEGVDFSAFNSIENAADIYFVAETLGYDLFNYYGISYGTLLGQYVMDQSQEHDAQLRSVILDGVVTSNIDFNAPAAAATSTALRNLFAECAADEECNAAYPNLESVFLSLVDQLNEEPIPVTLKVSDESGGVLETIEANLDGEDLVMATFVYLRGNRNNRVLPHLIYDAVENGNLDWVIENMSPGYSATADANAMYIAIICARVDSEQLDGNSFFEEPYEQTSAMNRDAEKVKRQCELVPVDREEPFVLDHVETPTLILNGSRDPITPAAYGEYVADQLDTAYVFTVPGSGHGSLLNIPCSGEIVLEFLADPTLAPDGSCLNERQPPFEVIE